MTDHAFSELKSELAVRAKKVRAYIREKASKMELQPKDLKSAVTDYVEYGGKMLRPGVLLFSCGAVGGDEEMALPAAAAIELFHTWTLVHDDIIDMDEKRRGQDALHIKYYKRAVQDQNLQLPDDQARHYGQSISILAGDAQHGLAISALTDLFYVNELDPKIVLRVIKELDAHVLNKLVTGETLDVFYAKRKIDDLSENEIKAMLWGKTGALYEFAGRAGALIGLRTADRQHPMVQAIASFTSKCGIAFQLLDDVLGLVGDEKKLGKPIGSDIREGKKTIILYHTLKRANPAQKQKILNILGRPEMTESEFLTVLNLVKELGGIEICRKMADNYLADALYSLDRVPDSKYKRLLRSWANYLIQREF